jgi:hypothetical protein
MDVHDLVEQGALDGHLALRPSPGGEGGLAAHVLKLGGQGRVDGEANRATPTHPAVSFQPRSAVSW